MTAAPHAFVSYVHEDREVVDKLCSQLREKGVALWLDRDKIHAGERWRVAIRQAIRDGAFFLACFSRASLLKRRSYMNAELMLAIDELRSRPAERIWFIPVLLDSVELPEREIGGGETLSSLHHVLLYENWDAGVEALLRVLAPQKTPLDLIRSSLRIEVNDLLIENKPLLTVPQSGESVYDWGHYWLHSVWSLTILVRNTSNEALPVAPNGLSLTLPTFIAVRRDDIVERTPLENQNEHQLELKAPLFRGLYKHVLCDSSRTEVKLPSRYV